MRIRMFLAAALILLAALPALAANGDGPAKLLRMPAVSADHVAFVFANDIWITGRDGGEAVAEALAGLQLPAGAPPQQITHELSGPPRRRQTTTRRHQTTKTSSTTRTGSGSPAATDACG